VVTYQVRLLEVPSSNTVRATPVPMSQASLWFVWVSPNEHLDRKFKPGQIEFLPTKFSFLLSSNDSKILEFLKKNSKINYEWISYGIWLQSNKLVRKIIIKHFHNGPVFNVQSKITDLPAWKARRYFEYVWGVEFVLRPAGKCSKLHETDNRHETVVYFDGRWMNQRLDKNNNILQMVCESTKYLHGIQSPRPVTNTT
jgi:hypothetical protein